MHSWVTDTMLKGTLHDEHHDHKVPLSKTHHPHARDPTTVPNIQLAFGTRISMDRLIICISVRQYTQQTIQSLILCVRSCVKIMVQCVSGDNLPCHCVARIRQVVGQRITSGQYSACCSRQADSVHSVSFQRMARRDAGEQMNGMNASAVVP